MANNNDVNNLLPSGITATGTININTTGSGTTNIGNSSGGILSFASNANSTFTTNNSNFTLATGTGTINICADSTAQTINIGSSSTNKFLITSSTSVINSGTSSTDSSITYSGSSAFGLIGDHSLSINSSGDITVGNTSGASWGIGTKAVALTINIGNTSSSSTMTIDSGTGAIAINKAVTIGNTTGTTQINISCGSGGISYPFRNVSGDLNLGAGSYTINNSASLLTMKLPSTASIGTILRLIGNGSSGWKITQFASQVINSTATSTTAGTGGSLSSGGRYDSVELVCTVANTTFTIVNSKGTLTFV
jgi:hypothetical protein